jgi:hypothetical protein
MGGVSDNIEKTGTVDVRHTDFTDRKVGRDDSRGYSLLMSNGF